MRYTEDVRRVDLAALEPYVARPGTVSRNGLPVSQIERQKIDQAFIGSCANGQLEDLEIAAEILRGNTVAPGVRLLVTPASQAVYREAMRLGYLQDIADAGAVITNSTCGACFGYHMGVVGPGRSVPDVEYPQLHRPDGQPRGADLHGFAGDRRRVGAHRLHHRREERDRMTTGHHRKGLGVRRRPQHRRHVPGLRDEDGSAGGGPTRLLRGAPRLDRRGVAGRHRAGGQGTSGVGSSRPVAALFTELGVAGLVAEEFNSLFFRNAVNAGLPAMTLPEATTMFSEGDIGTFDLGSGAWRNETTGASGSVPKLPDLILDIISSGGVLPRLAAQGYLPAELGEVLRSSTVAIRGAGSGA